MYKRRQLSVQDIELDYRKIDELETKEQEIKKQIINRQREFQRRKQQYINKIKQEIETVKEQETRMKDDYTQIGENLSNIVKSINQKLQDVYEADEQLRHNKYDFILQTQKQGRGGALEDILNKFQSQSNVQQAIFNNSNTNFAYAPHIRKAQNQILEEQFQGTRKKVSNNNNLQQTFGTPQRQSQDIKQHQQQQYQNSGINNKNNNNNQKNGGTYDPAIRFQDTVKQNHSYNNNNNENKSKVSNIQHDDLWGSIDKSNFPDGDDDHLQHF